MDKDMNREDIKHQAGRYACLLLGTAIVAFGLFNVHGQSGITEGGVLGATLLIQHWTGISPAVSEIVLDAICYALGFAFLGRRFLVDSLIATCAYAGFYALFEGVGYVLPNMGHMPVLAAVIGALFVGVGVGLIVRQDAADGHFQPDGLERVARLPDYGYDGAYAVAQLYSGGENRLLADYGDAVLADHWENPYMGKVKRLF